VINRFFSLALECGLSLVRLTVWRAADSAGPRRSPKCVRSDQTQATDYDTRQAWLAG
jgi:hypothetical protein